MDDYLSDGDVDGDGESEEELNERSSEDEDNEDEGNEDEGSEDVSNEDEDSEDLTHERAGEKEQHFDKSLAACHSYMGGGLQPLRGRAVLEPGWRGRLPVTAHSGAVFPGETVPMLLPDPDDATLIGEAIHRDKLFGLLCPDATGSMVSGYGVVCEMYEAGCAGAGPARGNTALSCKARARHRFRLLHLPDRPVPMHFYTRMQFAEVCVLPEVHPAEPLRLARLASLDALRAPRPAPAPRDSAVARFVRGMDAALTPWPRFVYEMLDYRRVRDQLNTYFSSFDFGPLPEEPVALSFWVASNLTLSPRDRLALFAVNDALLRLYMELRYIARRSALCCAACDAEIAQREDVLPMSSEGVHSNYTNSGGYMHDIMTVSRAGGVQPSGRRSAEFSWFPGYAWTILVCAACSAHLGWRFDALSRSLRPQRFFGLCRNYVQPRADEEPDCL